MDLFCGAGGCARGYQLAGFDVTGIDIKAQPRYAGDRFIQGDALEYVRECGREFDVIHASPPCQAYTALRAMHPDREYPDLLSLTRIALESSGRPWAIENVMGAPVNSGIKICGTMFDLRVYRHRWFETPFMLMQPHHPPHLVKAGGPKSQRQRKAHYLAGGFVTITGDVGSYCGPAMGIDWMTGEELSQAIPPAYTEFIGRHLLQAI